MPLTDSAIRNAKPAKRPLKLFDGEGLHLFVTPQGSKLWRLKYRVNGRERTLSLGPYPTVSLRDARKAKDEAKEMLARGSDPSAERREAKARDAAAAAQTFESIADEVLVKMRKEGRSASTLAKADWLVSMANASFGNRPIADISAREILDTLKAVERRGNFETAKRLRSTISRVFRHAVATERANTDPTFALRGALVRATPTPRAAITDLAQLRELYGAIEAYSGQRTTRAALLLMALLVPRPGELRQAKWSEFDTAQAVWTIPAERTKMRRTQRVPLPSAALAILDELQPITGWGDFVLPSIRSPRRPLSENTMNAALRTLGYAHDEMTSHGFRASFSTIANESGLWSADAIERALAHVDANAVRRAYARGEHWDERVRLAEWWAEQLQADGAMG